MKNIIKSLIVVCAVGAIATGATRAYFSDTATISGETFSTGTLNVEATGDETYYIRGGVGVRTEVPVVFKNLKPGDTMRQWITLHNSGTLDIGSLTVQATNVTKNDSNLLGQIKTSIIGYSNGSSNAYFTPDWNTGGKAINNYLISGPVDIMSSGAMQYNQGVTNFTIPAGENDLIIIDYTVPTDMGNGYQGTTATFDLSFVASQIR